MVYFIKILNIITLLINILNTKIFNSQMDEVEIVKIVNITQFK